MASKKVASFVLDAGRRALATPPVSSVIRRLGLNAALSKAYWRLQYHAAGGAVDQRVGDAAVTFRAGSPDQFRHYQTLVDERPILEDLLARLDPDDTFYDVGAYVGTYTCLAAAVLPDGEVVTFEPRDATASRIEANLAHNDLSADVRRMALSDETGDATMRTDGVAQLSTGGGEDVAMTTGDALVDRGAIPAPNVVKIDVEGAELDAIRGLSETLSRPACRLVYCEVHPTFLSEYGASNADVRDELEDLGFDVTTMHDRGEEYFVRAEK